MMLIQQEIVIMARICRYGFLQKSIVFSVYLKCIERMIEGELIVALEPIVEEF